MYICLLFNKINKKLNLVGEEKDKNSKLDNS